MADEEVDLKLFGIDAESELEDGVSGSPMSATLPKILIVHHSVTPRDFSPELTEKSINNNHKERFNFKSSLGYYVGYNYIIYGDGFVKQYRRDGEMGAHTIGHNHDSIGICLIGNFDVEIPSVQQVNSLTSLLREKADKFGISPENVFPHRKFAKKSCYGKLLADNWAGSLINKKKGASMFFQVNGSKAVWIYYEGVWIFVASEKDWKATWPNAVLVHISQAEFDQFPKAINTLK